MNKDHSLRNNSLSIFHYLKDLFALQAQMYRDIRHASDIQWKRNVTHVPEHESVYKKKEEVEGSSDLLLSVTKQEVSNPPAVPEELDDWIEGEINSPAGPELKEYRLVQEEFESQKLLKDLFYRLKNQYKDKAQLDLYKTESVSELLVGEYEPLKDWVTFNDKNKLIYIKKRKKKLFIKDKPELKKLFEEYVEDSWEPWREENSLLLRINDLYRKLYGLRTFLKTHEDGYQLLWSHDLLTWKKGGEIIYHPFLFTPVNLRFEADKKKIEVSIDSTQQLFFDPQFLDGLDIPNIIDIYDKSKAINSNGYDVWSQEAIKLLGNELVNYLSMNGVCNVGINDEQIEIGSDPSYWKQDELILKKKSNMDWSNYAERIIDRIESGEDLPPFIQELAGSKTDDVLHHGQRQTISDENLYFPLPWNDEQKEIANMMEAGIGAVVQGPPGTGKSHTITNLIARFLAQGKSVLVTSQTGKALEVLKDKLPLEIRDLVISQVGGAEVNEQIKNSVSRINAKLDDKVSFTNDAIKSKKLGLKKIRREKATILSKIKHWVTMDAEYELSIDGETFTPTKAAKKLAIFLEESGQWIPDSIPKDLSCILEDGDLVEACKLLKNLSNDEQKLTQYDLPSFDILPELETAENFFIFYKKAKGERQKWDDFSKKRLIPEGLGFDFEELQTVVDESKEAISILNSFDSEWELKIHDLISSNQEEQDRWSLLYEDLKKIDQKIRDKQQKLRGHTVKLSCDLTLSSQIRAAKEIISKVGDKNSISFIDKLLFSANAKEILGEFSIQPDNLSQLDSVYLLLDELLNKQLKIKATTLWRQAFIQCGFDFSEVLQGNFLAHELEAVVNSLRRLVSYSKQIQDLVEFQKRYDFFSKFDLRKKDSLEQMFEILNSAYSQKKLGDLNKKFRQWIFRLEGDNLHPIKLRIVEAIKKINSDDLRREYENLRQLKTKKKSAKKLQVLRRKIKKYTPRLFELMKSKVMAGDWNEAPKEVRLAWNMRRMESWLDELHSEDSLADLEAKYSRLKSRESRLIAELVAVKSWFMQKKKVTKKQRQALSAYAHAVVKIGSGYGKLADHWRDKAHKAMKNAKKAVPVWIMPLDKVLNMFSEPEAGMFDVVIFDEASQIDPRGISVAYLGKKVLVVGDPEQISPTKFTNKDDVVGLISKHLSNVSFSENFSMESSFFDIAKIFITNSSMLLEHFRCIPEIIHYSNKLCYEGNLKVLRTIEPRWKFDPAVESIYIEDGYENLNNKVNEPEAEAIVEHLKSLIEEEDGLVRPDGDGGVRPTTFGIITLLGGDQGKYITQLLMQRFDEDTLEKHEIIAGNPYAFQGDERDVIFLSLVKGRDQQDPESKIYPLSKRHRTHKQRFNVAMSRARDKVVLFHSILQSDLSNLEIDLRASLLQWFIHRESQDVLAGIEAIKREVQQGKASEFELEVGTVIANRGYRVIPQYEVANYRIDLVVQGEEAQLAVECDGDQYHGPDRWEADIKREQILRRAGWKFWRVSGSSFYRHKKKALDSLWEKLDEMGIKPISEE